MNTKQEKKLSPSKYERKIAREYRREMRKLAREDREMIESAMKPKPDWMPWGLWLWMAGFFIKIKK